MTTPEAMVIWPLCTRAMCPASPNRNRVPAAEVVTSQFQCPGFCTKVFVQRTTGRLSYSVVWRRAVASVALPHANRRPQRILVVLPPLAAVVVEGDFRGVADQFRQRLDGAPNAARPIA